MRDPNPRVAGRGFRKLRKAGVRVIQGVCGEDAKELNRHFIVGITRQRPYVHVKIAQTTDGFIAPPRGRRVWVSSPESRRLVHQWRASHDAVVVGAGTIKADDPLLDARRVGGRAPAVVILDGRLTSPVSARVFRTASRRRVIVCAGRAETPSQRRKAERLKGMGVEVLTFRPRRGRLPLHSILRELYRRHIGSLLVEGGSRVFGQFLFGGPVDQLSVFVAPTAYGAGVPAVSPQEGTRRRKAVLLPQRMLSRKVGRDTLLQVFGN
jgi:diaminohydroxyphosphoribosylaminopyrimidine deaminase/5-amino-6-(5-phosphoribosylamino)uracil reductase